MEKNELFYPIEKFLEEIIYELNFKASQKFIEKIINFFFISIENFSLKTSNLCEKKVHNILNEKNFFFALKKLKWDRYITETNEEKNRVFDENLKFDQLFV